MWGEERGLESEEEVVAYRGWERVRRCEEKKREIKARETAIVKGGEAWMRRGGGGV